MKEEAPSLDANEGVVSSRILDALKQASATLDALGIPHAIVGGLAVGAWGHPRATKDVDFLVREADAFDAHGVIVAFKSGVPININKVQVDYLTTESIDVGLEDSSEVDPKSGYNFVSIEVLFLMKLIAHRMQDQADVVNLIRKGAPVARIGKWLTQKGRLVEARRLDVLLARAREEG